MLLNKVINYVLSNKNKYNLVSYIYIKLLMAIYKVYL